MKWAMINALFLAIAASLLAGCESKSSKGPIGQPTPSDDHSHSHEDGTEHSHSHGDLDPLHDHEHDSGPHGGKLIDWGGGRIHVELTIDRTKKLVTAYLLDSDAKTLLPIDATEILLAIKNPKIQLQLKAEAREGEPQGKSSRFVGTDDRFAELNGFEGSVSGVVEGTPYSGSFTIAADER